MIDHAHHRRIASNSRSPGGFGLLACSMPLGFDIRPRRPALEPCDLVALRRNRSLQFRHLFQKPEYQALQLGRRQTINILGQRHARKESDSPRLGNLIIIPTPRLLLLLRLTRLSHWICRTVPVATVVTVLCAINLTRANIMAARGPECQVTGTRLQRRCHF